MLAIDIPGVGLLELEHLVLDLNGTIACGGEVVEGVADALASLGGTLRVLVVTADTHGTAERITRDLGVEVRVIARGAEAEAKLDLVDELGADGCAFVGNGSNDALALRAAAVGVAVIGGEGAARRAVDASDVVVTSIADALALFTEPSRLSATLRR